MGKIILLFFVHLGGVEFAEEIICLVDAGVNQPHAFGLGRVVAVALAEHAEDSARLVVLLAVFAPNGDLSNGELTSCLSGAEFFKSNSFVLVGNFSVSSEHSDRLTSGVNGEVN